MAQKKKRLEKARRNPKNVTFDELSQILYDHGFIIKRITGSHHVFAITLVDREIVYPVPRQKPVMKIAYVKEVFDILESLQSNIEQEDDEDD